MRRAGWELQVLDLTVSQCRDLVLSFLTCQNEPFQMPLCPVNPGGSVLRLSKLFRGLCLLALSVTAEKPSLQRIYK